MQQTSVDTLYRKHPSTKIQHAVDLLLGGYMCSESIVMAFADGHGLAPETVARAAYGFAGGMTQGKTCGAVTGAIMIIGLKYGPGLRRDPYVRDRCIQLIQEFCHRFRIRRQTLECRTILSMNQIDFNDPEAMKTLRAKKLCDKIVRDAAEILEALCSEVES
jgi:C_GCAxxG_C_C family probable redox protein